MDKWCINLWWYISTTSQWTSGVSADLTRGRPSNESSHRSKFTMEDPANFSHQKISQRNLTVYLLLFLSYIDDIWYLCCCFTTYIHDYALPSYLTLLMAWNDNSSSQGSYLLLVVLFMLHFAIKYLDKVMCDLLCYFAYCYTPTLFFRLFGDEAGLP